MITLRTDHIAGGFFIAVGVIVLALSGDLPFGTLASPGSGMMPITVTVLMMVFGLILIVRAKESLAFATADWSDFKHAARVVLITAVAIAIYLTLGFILTMALLMFALLIIAERRRPFRAALFSIGITLLTYYLFTYPLRTPLEQGIFGF